jgi:hypothetical protein
MPFSEPAFYRIMHQAWRREGNVEVLNYLSADQLQ